MVTDASEWFVFPKDFNNRWGNFGALFSLPYQVRNKCTVTASPLPKKIQQTKFTVKIMMLIFFYHKNVIYQHVAPSKSTVIGVFLFEFWNFLRQHTSIKCHEILKNWTSHHKKFCYINADMHVTTMIQKYFTKIQY